MAFEPNKITREHIFEAVTKIEKEKTSLNHSIRYDVIINGKRYPPKEIIRISYKIATGLDAGLIYGGEQVNLILNKLDFKIDIKNSFWKLGCNWGKGSPNFFNLLKENNIVIGTSDRPYKIGDLILITEGFTVVALGKILEKPVEVTTRLDLKTSFEKHQIPFENFILISKVEIKTLKKSDIFLYQLQQGIVKVRSNIIIEKATNIWDNYTNTELLNFNFYLKEYHEKSNKNWKYPCFIFEPKAWEESSFKTSFDLYYYRDFSNRIEIGPIKILNIKSNITSLEKEFNELGDDFCSLGQTFDFYNKVKEEFPLEYIKVLNALKDCSLDKKVKEKFQNNIGFKTSLIKSSEAEFLLINIDKIISGNFKEFVYDFEFEYKIEDAERSHVANFTFNNDINIPNKFFCIVGKNATGKTKFITQLTNKLADEGQKGSFKPSRPTFSKIIAASFSYFDKFRFPERNDTNYEFIGIKNRKGIIEENEYSNIIWKSYKNISEDQRKKKLWVNSIESSLEVDYLNFDLNNLFNISYKNDFIELTENIFSSGQNIIFQFITRFIECIEYNSLLVFDEPETHLHPNIAGRLIRTINNILIEYKSFCILSTHSPIIVQEIPSKYIKIFDRQGKYPLIYNPVIECFGENLSVISNSLFKVDEEKELYKEQLESLSKKMNYEQINNLFENSLSLNARLYLKTKYKDHD